MKFASSSTFKPCCKSKEESNVSNTIAVVGFGPGTSTAVAERFGKEGFSVALIGRNEDRLAAGVAALKGQGIDAFAAAADAADAESLRAAIRSVRSHFGSITVLHWNAYGGMEAGDLLTADAASLHRVFRRISLRAACGCR